MVVYEVTPLPLLFRLKSIIFDIVCLWFRWNNEMNRLMRIVGIRVETNKLMSIIGIQFLRIRYSIWVAPIRRQKRILPFSFELVEN